MNLLIDRVDISGVRVGKLMFNNGKWLETPCCLLYSRGGAIPDLCQDVWREIPALPKMVSVPLPTV